MKKNFLLALSLAAAPIAVLLSPSVPAAAQTSAEQRRWEDAQARYRAEFENYLRERDRYIEARARERYGAGSYRGGSYGYDDRDYRDFQTDYDAARYYRDGPQYGERVLTANDEVYRGSDGRYYCKRNDGTTGLIVGGAGGALLGNVLDGGRSRGAGTLIGGALGALLGRSIERNQQDIRCR